MIKEVERRHVDFAHRVAVVKHSREGRVPTHKFVDELQSLIEEELRMVEADELVMKNRKRAP